MKQAQDHQTKRNTQIRPVRESGYRYQIHPDASMEHDSSRSAMPPRKEPCQIKSGKRLPSLRGAPSGSPREMRGEKVMPRRSFRGPCFSFPRCSGRRVWGDRHRAASGWAMQSCRSRSWPLNSRRVFGIPQGSSLKRCHMPLTAIPQTHNGNCSMNLSEFEFNHDYE